MKDLKKITIVNGWKPETINTDHAQPADPVELDGWIDPEEAIKKTSDKIGGYTTVTHTVKDEKYSFHMDEADEIRGIK